MKRCLTLLVVREMQIKSNGGVQFSKETLSETKDPVLVSGCSRTPCEQVGNGSAPLGNHLNGLDKNV